MINIEKYIKRYKKQSKLDGFNLHKKTKEATGKYQKRSPGIILDSDNTTTETDKK